MSNLHLFRKQTLDELNTPKQINEFVRVTQPPFYLVLSALTVCCLVVCLWVIFGTISNNVKAYGILFPHNGAINVDYPSDAIIDKVLVSRGTFVNEGKPMFVVKTDKNVTDTIKATISGYLLSYMHDKAVIKAHNAIAYIIPQKEDYVSRELVAFVNSEDIKELKVGRKVQVTPSDLNREDYGYVTGKIKTIDPFPITPEEAANTLHLSHFVNELFMNTTAHVVKIQLDLNKNNPKILNWSRKKSEKILIRNGTKCNVQIITGRRHIYSLLLRQSDNDLLTNE